VITLFPLVATPLKRYGMELSLNAPEEVIRVLWGERQAGLKATGLRSVDSGDSGARRVYICMRRRGGWA